MFEKNANIFAKNWQKSPKIVIVASPPGTDVMILKIFLPKNWRFLLKTKLNYAKIGS
jgi:hypothetical protein